MAFWGVIIFLAGLYFAFKYKQADGRRRRNDLFVHFGGGSFTEAVLYRVMRLIYGILAITCILGGLGMLLDS